MYELRVLVLLLCHLWDWKAWNQAFQAQKMELSPKIPGLNPSLLQQAWIQAFGHLERSARWDKLTNIFKKLN